MKRDALTVLYEAERTQLSDPALVEERAKTLWRRLRHQGITMLRARNITRSTLK